MSLIDYAKKELEQQGLFDKDSNYDGMLGKSTLELITVFSKQGHSGYSASLVRQLFNILSNFKPLSPITNNPIEWEKVEGNMWQNKRDSAKFSEDGGKTWYDVDEV